MKSKKPYSLQWLSTAVILTLMMFPACSQQSMQRAGQGAVTGAAVGAVGGIVSALVFGGDVGDAAARGAVWGGSTGAASGAISGTVADSNQKKAQQATELEALRKKLGDDTFQGLVTLAECKHEVALRYGRKATASNNPDYALAGLWLQTLVYADSGQIDQARTMFSQLMDKDDNITAESQAESELETAHKQLVEIRKEYNLVAKCS